MIITNAGGTDFSTFISDDELKLWLRIDHDDDDTIVQATRAAAFEFVQSYCQVYFGTQVITAYLDGYYNGRLMVSQIDSVTSVEIIASGSTDYATLDTSKYTADVVSSQPRVWFQGAPSLVADRYHPVKVIMSGGYTTSNVPEQLLLAVKNYAAHLYENRMAVTPAKLIEKPMGIYTMLSQYRSL